MNLPQLRALRRAARHLAFRAGGRVEGIDYWRSRARRYGSRAALNAGHPEVEMAVVTKRQIDTTFPFLRQQLSGHEHRVMDLGCGPGRFTVQLADLVDGTAVGVDPVEGLLALAPRAPNVQYALMAEAQIPFSNADFDVVWCCLVLGGIVDSGVLMKTIEEVARVLKDDGLLFLIENTSVKPSPLHWHFRSVVEYQRLFEFVDLVHLSDYDDLGETISIMAGRRRAH